MAETPRSEIQRPPSTPIRLRTGECGRMEARPAPPDAEVRGGMRPNDIESHYLWTPSPPLAECMPAGMTIGMYSVRGKDGHRRFLPDSGGDDFIAQGYAGGMAVQMQFAGLTDEEKDYRQQLWLLFVRTVRSRERLRNRFLSLSSLRGKDVLPEDLGLAMNDQGKPWGLDKVATEGRKAAAKRGIAKPTERQIIALGLYVAAQQAPFATPRPQEVTALVRRLLFDNIGTGTTRVRRLVTEKLRDTLRRYLKVQVTDRQFNERFLGPKNNVIGILSKQHRRREGHLDRHDVRGVLLDLGWQAYGWVSHCLHIMLSLFADLVPGGLTEQEHRLFAEQYLPRPYLGCLSPLLLMERASMVAPALEAIWADPTDPQAVGVLHRLLHLHAELAIRRRDADRNTKNLTARRTIHSRRSKVLSLESLRNEAEAKAPTGGGPEDDAEPDNSDASRFAAIMAAVRAKHGIQCGCPSPSWLDSPSQAKDRESIRLTFQCTRCTKVVRVTVTLGDLRELGGVSGR